MTITNWVPTNTGKVRAVCEHCDRKSKPVEPRSDGQPTSWHLTNGWSCAPYPADYEHRDGSRGTLFTCPSCKALRDERQRRGITPLLSPSPERTAAIMARRETSLT